MLMLALGIVIGIVITVIAFGAWMTTWRMFG